MKRYMAFEGGNYYPFGGMEDFVGDFDTEEEAKSAIDTKTLEDYTEGEMLTKDEYIEVQYSTRWAHIYDLEKKEIIWSR